MTNPTPETAAPLSLANAAKGAAPLPSEAAPFLWGSTEIAERTARMVAEDMTGRNER